MHDAYCVIILLHLCISATGSRIPSAKSLFCHTNHNISLCFHSCARLIPVHIHLAQIYHARPKNIPSSTCLAADQKEHIDQVPWSRWPNYCFYRSCFLGTRDLPSTNLLLTASFDQIGYDSHISTHILRVERRCQLLHFQHSNRREGRQPCLVLQRANSNFCRYQRLCIFLCRSAMGVLRRWRAGRAAARRFLRRLDDQ
jgi:hypothetical protein